MAWRTVVSLKQKQIVVASGDNAGTYSWNDWYNPHTQQWEELTLTNGEPPYNGHRFHRDVLLRRGFRKIGFRVQ